MPTAESVGSYQQLILSNAQDPEELERLYLRDRRLFTAAFDQVFPQIALQPIAQSWRARLHPPTQPSIFADPKEAIFWLIATFLSGCMVKYPQWANHNPEFYLTKQVGFLFFPFVLLFFAWKNRVSFSHLAGAVVCMFVSAVYVHQLPDQTEVDAYLLALLHMPFFIWSLMGLIYAQSGRKTLDFLRFNGDWIVMSVLIGLATGLFLALTAGLFQLIQIDIEPAMEKYILVWGIPAIPLFAAYQVESNPTLVSKISPLIARVFTPFVLVMLVFFLVAVFVSEHSIYQDRDFLLLFNVVLLAVMAIILFSLSDMARYNQLQLLILFALSVVTILANGMALSAILHRTLEGGFTPNRLAVCGSNLIMFVHLFLIARNIGLQLLGQEDSQHLHPKLRFLLPAIAIWSLFVAIGFPLIFA